MRLIYLASPYNDPSPTIREARKEAVADCMAYFARTAADVCIYSPIMNWGYVAVKHTLPHSFDFWAQQDFHMIQKSRAVWVLKVEGWEDSYGIRQEMEYANNINRPLFYVYPEHRQGKVYYYLEEVTDL